MSHVCPLSVLVWRASHSKRIQCRRAFDDLGVFDSASIADIIFFALILGLKALAMHCILPDFQFILNRVAHLKLATKRKANHLPN